MGPETKFKLKIRPLITALPGAIFFKIQQRSIRGVPDLVGCINGRFVALELKVDKHRADPLQAHYLKRIAESGGISYVVTPENWHDVYEVLKKL